MAVLVFGGLLFSFGWSAVASDCSKTSVGLTPINDLGTGMYKGEKGGLYPDGKNVRPPPHDTAGQLIGDAVVPRNGGGQPDPGGRYVLISIGMSNTTQEFTTFKTIADAAPAKDPRLVIVDGAQSAVTAGEWAKSNSPWETVDSRLAAAGVTPQQVAVAWVKVVDANPDNGWPAFAQTLKDEMVVIAQKLTDRYPNIRLAYFSSRIYAGYATGTLSPEPYAYESGFSAKWLIGDQLAGSQALNFKTESGAVEAPWLSWGPYLWADGLVPRSDGLTWACSDLQNDGVHPSASGKAKVAGLLLDYFRTDSTAHQWFSPSAPTKRDVSLHLRKHLVAWGEVTTAKGFVGCIQDVKVRIQRKAESGWNTVDTDRTDNQGDYKTRVNDRVGKYRARVLKSVVGAEGDQECRARSSSTKGHAH